MTSREVILREIGLTPIWVSRLSVADTLTAELSPPVVTPVATVTPVAPATSAELVREPELSLANREAAIANLSWDELIVSIAGCTACKLCTTRTKTVPGSGDRSPSWMVITDAPDDNEDKQGEPFVGRAGQLLDAMLVAIGKKRGDGIYIANVIKCRPPGDRIPEPDEIAACAPYLNRQITLAQPKLLLAAGVFAAQTLLNTDDTVEAMRGLPTSASQRKGVPIVVTDHPSYLLLSPLEKAKAWDDLLKAKAQVA
jgi:uracil-DNA glycosylase family 4